VLAVVNHYWIIEQLAGSLFAQERIFIGFFIQCSEMPAGFGDGLIQAAQDSDTISGMLVNQQKYLVQVTSYVTYLTLRILLNAQAVSAVRCVV
jgi:hypothetical protein